MTSVTVTAADDIVDAEIVSRAAVLRTAAARKARAAAVASGKATAAGGVSLARRYGRGLRHSGRDFVRYWNDVPGADDINECEPGRREQAKASHDKAKVHNRAVVVGAVLASLAWCTAGWTVQTGGVDRAVLTDAMRTAGLWLAVAAVLPAVVDVVIVVAYSAKAPVPARVVVAAAIGAMTLGIGVRLNAQRFSAPGVAAAVLGTVGPWILQALACIVVFVFVAKGRHRHGWLWPIALLASLAAAGLALFVHLWLGVGAGWMTLGWFTAASGWVLVAGRDGNLFGDEAPVATAEVIATDTRYNRIVAGFVAQMKLKDDGEPIRVVGAGLEPVDNLWSKMRLQFPGTITNRQIIDSVPGVASFMGISAERMDAVPVDDGHGGEIEGVVDIWLASGDQWKRTPAWPLLDAERTSVWEPAPFIVTDRGTPVSASLLFAMWMLVSKPRHGKTFAMRLLALVFAGDPDADFAVFDFKIGGRDWLWARPLAVASGFGNTDAVVEAYRNYLKSVLDSAVELGALFQALPEHLVPHGQLTREACAHEPRLRPLGIFTDEVHHALMHPKFGKEITLLHSRIARELPFIGRNAFIASQRADVRTSIPSQIRSLVANRVAGKLYSSRDSGDVLGDAANDMGYNAKNLRDVKGLFVVHGADDSSSFDGYTKGRAYLVDNVQAAAFAERALRTRQAAGVVPAGVEPVAPPSELLQAIDILREERVASMRSADLAARMETTPQRLLGRIGVRSRQEPADGWCKHVYLADLEAAASGTTPGLRVVS